MNEDQKRRGDILVKDIKFYSDVEMLNSLIKDRLIQIQRDKANMIDFLNLIGKYEECVDRALEYGNELLDHGHDLNIVAQRTFGYLDALIDEITENPIR